MLDHFFVSDMIACDISSYYAVHDGDNLSDHSPVVMRLDIGCQFQQGTPRSHVPKVAWHRATDQNIGEYKQILAMLLNTVECPYDAMDCETPNSCEHRGEIDAYIRNLNAACLAASEVCIPKSRKKRIAGWSEQVKRFKEKSIFWHRIWCESGRPVNGVLFEVMKQAKRDYKAAVKRVLRNQANISNARMADALSCNNVRDFWSEVKRKSSNHSPSPTIMDGVQGDEAICELFRDKYESLYNSVPYDEASFSALRDSVSVQAADRCLRGTCYCEHNVQVHEVSAAVRKLKRGKSGGPGSPSSDHFINAPREMFIHLSLLLTACIHHSFMSPEVLGSCLIPIPKNARKSKQDSDNYRSIAIGSILCKLLDLIVIAKHGNVLNSSTLQFGFKAGHSTVQCSFVVQEVIDHFVQNDALCHVLLLDASKAFDRVNFAKLFELLIKRGMCPLTILMLMHVYTNQTMLASWNGCTSDSFHCCNGVKQGGILSPLLFCVYVDELLSRLKSSKVGCHISNTFTGAFGYADDLTLIAPSILAAKDMLKTCEIFASEYQVKFNASKSQHLIVCKNRVLREKVCTLYLNNSAIDKCKTAVLLGTCIGDNSDSRSIDKACSDMIYRTNILMSKFAYCSSFVLSRLFDSYCSSYYGSPLWCLEDAFFCKFNIGWKKCMKRIWRLSQRTRSILIPEVVGKPSILVQLLSRFVSFIHSCFNATNPIVKLALDLATRSSTAVARNIRILLSYLNVGFDYLAYMHPSRVRYRLDDIFQDAVPGEAQCLGQVVRELCLVRDGEALCPLDYMETRVAIDTLCLSFS